jgi:pimeloyl-ACP methyl ester carboxylesterase
MRALRGLKALAHDAVDFTTELVREGHESSARAVMRVLGAIEPLTEASKSIDQTRRLVTDGVLGTIRGANRAVQGLTDAALDALEGQEKAGSPSSTTALPLRSDAFGSLAWLGDATLGALNGTVGHYLHTAENALDLGMKLRLGASYLPEEPAALALALRSATPRIALFIHGLSATEWSWCFDGEAYHGDPGASFGTLLERDLGYTPFFLRYNSGRHVSENGRELAEMLDRVAEALPTPLEELVLVGHSMGGLVARSACHYACLEGRHWPSRVTRVFSIGTPHLGAPLGKLGAIVTATLGAFDTPGTRIPARILAGRSSGMKDVRSGALVDEDWLGRDLDGFGEPGMTQVPLLPNARYYFISATVTRDPAHPLGRLVGDLLVRVPSASGRHTEEHTFPIEVRTHGGIRHHQLQNHPAVYEQIREACSRA